jgi:hypothetical protein
MTNSEQETSNPLPKTYEEIHKQALDRRFFRPVESDAAIPVFIPVTDKNPEYSKLLNEVITLRWKCIDQAAEIAALRQSQTDALEDALTEQLTDTEIEDALVSEGIYVWGPEGDRFERMFAVVMKLRAALKEKNDD